MISALKTVFSSATASLRIPWVLPSQKDQLCSFPQSFFSNTLAPTSVVCPTLAYHEENTKRRLTTKPIMKMKINSEASLAALLLVCRPALWFSIKLDLDIRGRNCDRPVERSPALEGLDELGALLRLHFQAATPERKSSPGVMASPGQPFWTGPSTTNQ